MPAADEGKIRKLMNNEEGINRIAFARAGGFSPAAFPLYARILDDPKEDSYIVEQTLWVLSKVNADRSRFLERAVAKLADAHPGVRLTAVELLAQIGSEQDAAPVVALLADEKWEVPFAAAKALAAIGDRRTLAAMDVWLNSGLHRANVAEYEAQRKHVAKCRDELKQRLEKAKKP